MQDEGDKEGKRAHAKTGSPVIFSPNDYEQSHYRWTLFFASCFLSPRSQWNERKEYRKIKPKGKVRGEAKGLIRLACAGAFGTNGRICFVPKTKRSNMKSLLRTPPFYENKKVVTKNCSTAKLLVSLNARTKICRVGGAG